MRIGRRRVESARTVLPVAGHRTAVVEGGGSDLKTPWLTSGLLHIAASAKLARSRLERRSTDDCQFAVSAWNPGMESGG